eukprot:PhF_6_TR40480/c0_g2_i4/m.60534
MNTVTNARCAPTRIAPIRTVISSTLLHVAQQIVSRKRNVLTDTVAPRQSRAQRNPAAIRTTVGSQSAGMNTVTNACCAPTRIAPIRTAISSTLLHVAQQIV